MTDVEDSPWLFLFTMTTLSAAIWLVLGVYLFGRDPVEVTILGAVAGLVTAGVMLYAQGRWT